MIAVDGTFWDSELPDKQYVMTVVLQVAMTSAIIVALNERHYDVVLQMTAKITSQSCLLWLSMHSAFRHWLRI